MNSFNLFSVYLDCEWTDIVSFGNSHVIMMVRARGHALTVEIEKVKNEMRIDYFIPKLYNIEMINRLPGVNRVKEDADTFSGATGFFVASEEDIYLKLFKFISMVPMDNDMIFENSFNISR